MSRRLEPTGTCWCGCGTATETFFAPGHDKKAESKVIMGVFGSVPHFVTAFGYGPPPYDKDGVANNDAWAYVAKQLADLKQSGAGEKLAIEHPVARDRSGPLHRTPFQVKMSEPSLSDGAAMFTVPSGTGMVAITVPFADITAVYKTPFGSVVRTTGALSRNLDRTEYVAFGRDETRGLTARGALMLMELEPLKKAAMAAWARFNVHGLPPLHETPDDPAISIDDHRSLRCRDFENAKSMISIDDPKLDELCGDFTAKFEQIDRLWFEMRVHWSAPGYTPAFLDVENRLRGYYFKEGGEQLKGEKYINDAHAAYVMLLRHLDALMRF